MKVLSFIGFTMMMLSDIFSDSDDEAGKFDDNWKMELPTAFARYVSDDYIPPNCGPAIDKPDDNFTYLAIFSCSSWMVLLKRFAGLKQVMPCIRVNQTSKHRQLKS